LGLFAADEWESLDTAFREDHAALDARYADLVTGVVRSVRRMVSLGKADAEISDHVHDRLHAGLFCRILVMEMDMREQQTTSRPFLHRHDMRGMASVLVMNRGLIDAGHNSWSTYARRGSIREWIEAMLFPLIGLASPRNVHLEIAFNRGGKTPSIPLTVFPEAERDALGHVLIELVRNGIKYRDPGAAMSKVSVRVKETEGNLEITVQDNGVGIQDTENVWERGIRERPDLAEGDGDGLPSIMRHVSRWRWRINIDSKVGEGSTFTLSIPLAFPPLP
jgi:signal transduction histidine kinase